MRRIAGAALAALALACLASAESVRVSVPRANLRAEPSLTAAVLGGVEAGTLLEVLWSAGEWYRVKDVRGVAGYIHRSLVEPEPAPAAPEPTPAPAPEPPPPPPPAPRLVIQPPPPGAAETLAFAVGVELGYRDLTRAASAAKTAFDGSRGGASFGVQVRWSPAHPLFLGASLRFLRMQSQAPSLTLGLLGLHALAGAWLPIEGPVRPYLALGLGVATVSEEGRVAGVSVSQSAPSGLLAAGVEYARQRLILGLEASWCTAPDSPRLAALTRAQDSANLGGLAVVARAGLAF